MFVVFLSFSSLISSVNTSALAETQTESPKATQRIVSLGGGVTEILFALGLGDKIVAVDVSSLYPPEATKKPKVGYLRATSAEGIASMKPDVVIASEALGPPSVRVQLKAAGIKLSLVPEAKSVSAAMSRIKELGKLVHREAKAQEMIDAIERVLKTPIPKGTPPKVLFLFSHGGGRLMVAGRKTAAYTMIKAAGGVNAIEGYEGYRPLTAESVVAAQPDIILLTERSLSSIKGQEALWKIPSLSLTPAGKTKRSVVIGDLKLLGFGPRAGEAILELRSAFFSKK
jgi:iron complex transport system substrate-binding protein